MSYLYVDIVGVTGSIPVTPTISFQWLKPLVIVISLLTIMAMIASLLCGDEELQITVTLSLRLNQPHMHGQHDG